MEAFRCYHCFKVNITTEGQRCLYCGNEESRVPTIPENQTEVRSFSINYGDDFLHMQNKTVGTDFSVVSRESEKSSKAELHERDGKDMKTKTLNKNLTQVQNSVIKEMINSPNQNARRNKFHRVGRGRFVIHNSILKEIRISRGQEISSKPGPSVATKTLQHTSEESFCQMSKDSFTEQKTLNNNKSTKSMQNENTSKNLNLVSTCNFLPEKSKLDSFMKECINVNQLIGKISNSSGELLRKTGASTISSDSQENMKITDLFLQRSSRSSQEKCSKNDLNGKLPIKSIETPQKLYLCNKCRKEFNNNSEFNDHVLKHIKDDSCAKYLNEIHLERQNSHMIKGPFKCEVCDLVCISQCLLNQHRKKHILETAVDAGTAQQKVDQCSQLKAQETSVKGNPQKTFETSVVEKYFLCTKCGANFFCESEFNAHSQEKRDHLS